VRIRIAAVAVLFALMLSAAGAQAATILRPCTGSPGKTCIRVGGKMTVVGTLCREPGMLLCHRRTGLDELDEVGDGTVVAGSMGCGSIASMVVLQTPFPDLCGRIRIRPSDGLEGALAVLGVSRAFYEAHPEVRPALAMLLSPARDIEAIACGDRRPFRE